MKVQAPQEESAAAFEKLQRLMWSELRSGQREK